MKKVESVLDGSSGWGKTRTLATFPQILFCLPSLVLPKIFTVQGGEGVASASHPHVEAISRRLIRSYLTLQKKLVGGEDESKKHVYPAGFVVDLNFCKSSHISSRGGFK
jgi:hypothetical protein